MNILNKPKLIAKLANELALPEWEIHKAMFELNSGDIDAIRNYFDNKRIGIKILELLARVEDIHIHLMQAHINSVEYSPISVRIQHLKTDIKQLIASYKPNSAFLLDVKNVLSTKGTQEAIKVLDKYIQNEFKSQYVTED